MSLPSSLHPAYRERQPDRPDSAYTFCVTLFKDEFATTKSEQTMSLVELRDLILATTAASKNKLPFVKLAKFGDKINPKKPKARCLRHDGNVLEFSGVEL